MVGSSLNESTLWGIAGLWSAGSVVVHHLYIFLGFYDVGEKPIFQFVNMQTINNKELNLINKSK